MNERNEEKKYSAPPPPPPENVVVPALEIQEKGNILFGQDILDSYILGLLFPCCRINRSMRKIRASAVITLF